MISVLSRSEPDSVRRPHAAFAASALTLSALLLLASSLAVAATGANTTFVLHVVQAQFGPCNIVDPCQPGPRPGPTLEITEPGEPHVIYFIVRNYAEVTGLQADLAWPADWTWLFEITCPPNPLDCFHHGPNTISCSFSDCLTGGSSRVMAAIHMIPGSGCFSIVQSAWPGGTYVLDCQGQPEVVAERNLGRICVGPGGLDTCDPAVPVESATWGAIKAHYPN